MDRRQAILDAALELARTRPFDEITVSDVARTAGVSHGLVFYYFRDKWGVTAEALAQLLDDMRAFQTPPRGGASPADDLAAFVRRHLAYLLDRRDSYLVLMRGGAMARPEVRDLLDDARRRGVLAVAAILGLPEPLSPMDDLRISGWSALLEVCTERLMTEPALDLDVVADWAAAQLLASWDGGAPG